MNAEEIKSLVQTSIANICSIPPADYDDEKAVSDLLDELDLWEIVSDISESLGFEIDRRATEQLTDFQSLYDAIFNSQSR